MSVQRYNLVLHSALGNHKTAVQTSGGARAHFLGKLSLLAAVLSQCSAPTVLGFGALVPEDGIITPQAGKEERSKEQPSKEAPLGGQGASLCVDCSQGGARGHCPGQNAPRARGGSEPHPYLWEPRAFQEGRQSQNTQSCYTPLLGWRCGAMMTRSWPLAMRHGIKGSTILKGRPLALSLEP